MPRRVVITGVGALTPLGLNVDDTWKNLIKGKSGTGPLRATDPTPFRSKVSAEVHGFDPSKYLTPKQVKKTDIFVQYVIAGTAMAIEDGKMDLSKEDRTRVGAIMGSGIGGIHTIEEQHRLLIERGPDRLSPYFIPMLIANMAPGYTSIHFGLKGPNSCVCTACASGTHAVGDAFRIIQRGEAEIMFSGGSEACITPLGFGGFDAMRALSQNNDEAESASRPFDKTRDGFVIGEGCGILMLEELEHALKRNAKIYCEIVGYGMTADACHITAPDPEGAGATQCMIRAMKDAGLRPEDVTYINAHGTSTPLNDKIETIAIKRAFTEPVARKVMISSTKSMTGHLLGAGGAIESIFCALVIKEGIIPPTINYKHPDPDCDLDYVPNEARRVDVKVALSNSLGFGGHNATLCFKKIKP
ncbi:MAG: beta-ketoacyl-ACP synthase II [Candidatus Omnitrophica bacterium]|nr:beta-ketoacyl-ACP synthase II [Candidatus Omnitrophota bacterium]